MKPHAASVIEGITVDGIDLPTGITEMGPYALLVLVVATFITAFIRGWIIPKVHYEFIVKRSEAQQNTIDKQSETISVQARTIDKQTAVGDTVVRVMSSVQEAATSKASEAG